jgi:predicted secreted protein
LSQRNSGAQSGFIRIHANQMSVPSPANRANVLGRALFSVAVTAAVVLGTYFSLDWLAGLHH